MKLAWVYFPHRPLKGALAVAENMVHSALFITPVAFNPTGWMENKLNASFTFDIENTYVWNAGNTLSFTKIAPDMWSNQLLW